MAETKKKDTKAAAKAEPAKKAAPAKKAVAAKKEEPVKKAAPTKKAEPPKKPVAAKKEEPAKKAAPAKKAEPVKKAEEITEAAVGGKGMFAIKRANDGRYMFNVHAGNTQVIASSQMYTTMASCRNGIKSVGVNAPIAPIEDQTLTTVNKEKCPSSRSILTRPANIALTFWLPMAITFFPAPRAIPRNPAAKMASTA